MIEAGLAFVLGDIDWPTPMWTILFEASNGTYAGSGRIYAFEEEIQTFAQKLEAFPTNVGDGGEEVLEGFSVSLRPVVLNRAGRAAIEVEFVDRTSEHGDDHAKFAIPCEIGWINELGRRLLAWTRHPDEPLRMSTRGY